MSARIAAFLLAAVVAGFGYPPAVALVLAAAVLLAYLAVAIQRPDETEAPGPGAGA